MKYFYPIICLSIILIFSFKNVETRLVSEKIVGGEVAKAGQFMYQVSIQIDGKHVCGGAILNDYFVLTVAHCIPESKIKPDVKKEFSEYYVVAGVISSKDSSSSAIRISVKRAYIPEEYYKYAGNSGAGSIGDLAILKLNQRLGLGKNSILRKLNLPKALDTSLTYKGENPVIAGFGVEGVSVELDRVRNKLVENPTVARSILKYSKTIVIPNDVCGEAFNQKLHPSQLCAQVIPNKDIKVRGTCLGDDGGPLVINDDTVIGVLSQSAFGCYELGGSSVYTRVAYFLPFIEKVLKNGKLSRGTLKFHPSVIVVSSY